MKRDRSWLWLLPVLLVLFGWGVLHLFQLRFETGDVYPPYSSLRADPLGTRALYESLEVIRARDVRRFVQRLDRLPPGRHTTLLVLGADIDESERSSEDEYRRLERFMFDGGRIVVAFAPCNTRPRTTHDREKREKTAPEKKKGESAPGKDAKRGADPGKPADGDKERRRRTPEDEDDAAEANWISLRDRWNVGFGYRDLPKDDQGDYQSVRATKSRFGNLPDSISWHTALYFDQPGATWDTVYAREKRAVLIERRFGRGSLVLCADSYFLSNEALRKERHPELLSWLMGPSEVILFDETHLGVMDSPGVAALTRKYRLTGAVFGLILLAGLFVWKNAVPLAPPSAGRSVDEPADAVAGKESAAGFVNLLRRGVAPGDLPAACLEEWKRTRGHGRLDLEARLSRATEAVAEFQARPARDRDPVEAYRAVGRILSQRDGTEL